MEYALVDSETFGFSPKSPAQQLIDESLYSVMFSTFITNNLRGKMQQEY